MTGATGAGAGAATGGRAGSDSPGRMIPVIPAAGWGAGMGATGTAGLPHLGQTAADEQAAQLPLHTGAGVLQLPSHIPEAEWPQVQAF